jgi:hypothetical protein
MPSTLPRIFCPLQGAGRVIGHPLAVEILERLQLLLELGQDLADVARHAGDARAFSA